MNIQTQSHALTVRAIHPIHKKIGISTPAPTVSVITPAPTASGFNVVGAIDRVWGKDAGIGLAIASCESGLNPDAVNYNTDGSVDFSVFQVNTIHGNILDPEENIEVAHSIYQEQGTTPWNSSKSCWESKL